ncbi:cellulase family glycosylhydrolase [Rhodococcus sp. NPDC055112]
MEFGSTAAGSSESGPSVLGKHGDPAFLAAWGLVFDDPEIRAGVLDLWQTFVERFHREPSLFGYDLFNEPWFDPASRGLGVLDPLAAEGEKLTPLYQDLVDRIRTVDTVHWVLVEPFWGGVGSRGLPTRLGEIHDPQRKLAYAPHVYDLVMESGGDYTPAGGFVERYWDAVVRYPREHGMPLLIWEWGTRNPKSANAARYVQEVVSGIDDHSAGSMAFAWCAGLAEWCNLGADGRPGAAMAATVAAYPQRIAGLPVSLDTDPVRTHLRYRPEGDDPTVMVVPRAAFPAGYDVVVAGGSHNVESDGGVDVIRIGADPGAATVEVTVSDRSTAR